MDEDAYVDRLVDEEALVSHLESELGPAESFAVERHAAGHSNETLFVEWGGREYVLRRPPAGETAETAHDVIREYRVVNALQETDVPVPKTVLACADDSLIGGEFYLMERAAGDVLRDAELERFATPSHRERLSEELIATLAAIHAVDVEAVGLEEFGYPEGFTQRQVDRWAGQFEWAFEVTTDEREVPEIHELTAWLTEHVPTDHPQTLVHGDFKLDNVMYAPGTPPELVAVFDWELSTLGDPLTDLGWLLLFWHDPADPEPAIPELMSTFMAREGYLSRDELVERYEATTGLEFTNRRFYQVLGGYKMAALGEMFFRRYLEGNADDPLYPSMETDVPKLARYTLAMANGEVAL